MSKKLDIFVTLIFLTAFLISINLFDGLIYDILGIAFFIGFCYGVICVNKGVSVI